MQTATLFHHDDSQAVQLPPEFQLPGTQVYIKQVGNALVLLPMDQPWDPLVARHCQVVGTDAITGQQRTHFGLDAHRPGP